MKLTYLLRRQDSNLRPSPYESVMQPSTPRRGLKKPPYPHGPGGTLKK